MSRGTQSQSTTLLLVRISASFRLPPTQSLQPSYLLVSWPQSLHTTFTSTSSRKVSQLRHPRCSSSTFSSIQHLWQAQEGSPQQVGLPLTLPQILGHMWWGFLFQLRVLRHKENNSWLLESWPGCSTGEDGVRKSLNAIYYYH